MKKTVGIIIFAFVFLLGIVAYQRYHFSDGKLHIVFCSVGQGDAVLITTPQGKHILLDAGPDRSVLDCLSRHMPFWERGLSLVLLSHPHADHFTGFFAVFERYAITFFATENLKSKTSDYSSLVSVLQKKKIPRSFVKAGDTWTFSNEVTISVLDPTIRFLEETDPNGYITDSERSASLIIKISYGSFDLLATGDAPVAELRMVADEVDSLEVLQIPHHGSTTGIDEPIFDTLHPKFAVISVGKNTYGHPKKQVLDLLQEKQTPFLRTDNHGDIEIISDGKNWQVQ